MFDRWFEEYRWAWCVLCGLMLVVCFAPFSLAPCGWIALTPAWWVLTRSASVRRKPFRYGYLIGLIYFGGVFWWIGNVTAIGTFFLVLYLALYPAFWFLFVARLLRPQGEGARLGILLQAIGAAALWVTLEWWRSWCLTGFNWNELGISQAPSVIYRQLAAYGGVPLISFLLVAVNVLWAEGLLAIAVNLREKRKIGLPLPFAAALLLVAAGFALGAHHFFRHQGETPGPTIRFACIQPNIPQIPYDGGGWQKFLDKEKEAIGITEKLSLEAVKSPLQLDLLIWPEAVTGEDIFLDEPIRNAVRNVCLSYDGYFLFGAQFEQLQREQPGIGKQQPKLFNCAYLFTPHGDKFNMYRKTHLVMLGEFVPFANEHPWIRKVLGVGLDFSRGPGPEKFIMEHPDASFCPMICFEDTLPEVANKAVQLNPQFFITITNDGWYQGWCAGWGIRQHLANAIFRCVEHDRPMIRGTNNGISGLIDANGTQIYSYKDPEGREIDARGIFRGLLTLSPVHPTVYEAWGDWIILISGLVICMLAVRLFCLPRVK